MEEAENINVRISVVVSQNVTNVCLKKAVCITYLDLNKDVI